MIERLEITNLFGIENNNRIINFNQDITILAGLNGSGKTTILNILNAILTKEYYELTNYKFKEINIYSTNGNLKIIRIRNYLIVLRIDIAKKKDPQLVKLLIKLSNTNNPNEIKNMISNILSINTSKTITQIEFSKDNTKNIKKDLQQLLLEDIQNFYDIQEKDIIKDYFILINTDLKKEIKYDYSDFEFNFDSIYFPTYRRLEADFMDLLKNGDDNELFYFYERNKNMRNKTYISDKKIRTVIGYSNKDIAQLIKLKWDQINKIETKLLDSLYKKFIISLLDPLSNEYNSNNNKKDNIFKETYKKQLLEVFQKTFFIDRNDPLIKKINSYVEDLNWAENLYTGYINHGNLNIDDQSDLDKLAKASKIMESNKQIGKLISIYEETALSIKEIKKPFEILKTILSEFLHKEVVFEDGIMYFEFGLDKLTFEDLSAGEKQLASMFIYILLEQNFGTTIIIDEPELSLHVTWQRKFINAITENNSDTQFIVSTHSPFIISGYQNKIVRVGDIEEEIK